MHQELLDKIRNETDWEKGMQMFADYDASANSYADTVCREKGLK